jgi:hypothetical protein
MSLERQDQLNSIIRKPVLFIKNNFNYTDGIYNTTLWDYLNYFHLPINEIIYDKRNASFSYNLQPFLNLNYSVDLTNAETDSLDEDIESDFVLDNAFTNVQYPLEEVLNMLQEMTTSFSQEKNMLILFLYLLIISLLLGMFIYQPYAFYKINNIIFSKYYVNFNYLGFFQFYLTKKGILVNIQYRNMK